MKDRLVKLAEEFQEIYEDRSIGFAGISWGGRGILLDGDSMEDLFPNIEFEREALNEKLDKISATYRGKRFIALVDKEEE